MCLYMSVPQWWSLQKFARAINERINHTINVTFMLIYFKCVRKCSKAMPPHEINANEEAIARDSCHNCLQVQEKCKNNHWLNGGNKSVKLHHQNATATDHESSESKVINFNYFPPTTELPLTQILPHLHQQQSHQQHPHPPAHHQLEQHQVGNHPEQLLLVADIKVKTIPPPATTTIITLQAPLPLPPPPSSQLPLHI